VGERAQENGSTAPPRLSGEDAAAQQQHHGDTAGRDGQREQGVALLGGGAAPSGVDALRVGGPNRRPWWWRTASGLAAGARPRSMFHAPTPALTRSLITPGRHTNSIG